MSNRKFIDDAIIKMEEVVKKGKLRTKRKKLKAKVLRPTKVKIKDMERIVSCKKARKTAHTPIANAKRELSQSVRNDLGL